MTRNTRMRRVAGGAMVAATLALTPTAALAAPDDAGCEGLFGHARFATAKHWDTPGHDRVHEVFEAHGCVHHH